MGNSNSLLDDTKILDETKPVGFYIKNWALNNYQINPEMVKKSSDKSIFKNLLKKRACCTGQATIGIDLPYITETSKISIKNIQVQIFEDTNLITDDLCTMVYKEIPSTILKSFKYTNEREKANRTSNSDACTTLYDTHTYSLSKQLQENRKQYLPNLYESAYGPSTNKDDTTNPFRDLNCINSVYELYPDKFQAPSMSIQAIAQTNDARCNNLGQIAWKVADEAIKGPICVNTINVGGGISSSDGADLKLNQSCSASSTTNVNTQNNTVTAPTAPVTSQPAATTQPATTTQPAPATSQPAATTSSTSTTSSKPAPVTTQPAATTSSTSTTSSKPAPVTTQPAPVTTQPAPVTTQPAPNSIYNQPVPSTTTTNVSSKPAPSTTLNQQSIQTTEETSTIINYKLYIAIGFYLYFICIIFLIIVFLINKK
jgi:hypothetical protein